MVCLFAATAILLAAPDAAIPGMVLLVAALLLVLPFALGLTLTLVGKLARLYRPDEWALTAAEAREIALGLVRPGDAILVKGSRSVGLEVVADSLRGSAA